MPARKPSPEQALAIEHQGGVLLSAGAGAGKTFVLVEHVFYLIRKFIGEKNSLELSDLKEKLSTIVLMTFTKKAAGELEIRMQSYLDEIEEGDILYEKIEHVKESLSSLNITTIHGFCYLLIQKGFINEIDSTSEIITDLEYRHKISELVDQWFSENIDNRLEADFIANQDKIKSSFQKIFSSPELRSLWAKTTQSSEYEQSVLEELRALLNLDSLPQFAFLGKESAKVKTLLEYFKNIKINSFERLLEVEDFFKDFGTFPRSDELNDFKNLREFLKKNRENLEVFLDKREEFDQWASMISSIYQFVERRYLQNKGLNFSDLEYYIHKALKSPIVKSLIADEFDYFIIDEFQDTSEVQFQIVDSIVQGNLEKVFCVGDIKQAIYGFRGGEVKLIKKLSETMPKTLSLKDNYRSGKEIVSFNNMTFDLILNSGMGYKGHDLNSVVFEGQHSANSKIKNAEVELNRICLQNTELKSLSQGELERIEASYLEKYLENNSTRKICILYRKLTPVKYLLPLLIRNDHSFSLQMKVDIKSDPLWNVFKLLIEESDDLVEQIKVYFSYLNLDKDGIELAYQHFHRQKNIIGLWQAFLVFVQQLKIHNSNFDNNFSLIESLCKVSKNDSRECLERIDEHEEGSYSIDFRYGPNSDSVTIMTVHSSKGLEYDHVVLGGVSTNGKSMGFDDPVGNFPLSFKWASDHKFYKSPSYLIEELHKKNSEFSEAKRLFYVACTRAVEKLSWFDISLNGQEKSYSPNSWINALRKVYPEINNLKVIEYAEVYQQIQNREDNLLANRPEFHLSPLGVVGSKFNENVSLNLIPELSVTRFSDLAKCPRKFYLSHVLNLSEDLLELIPQWEELNSSKEHRYFEGKQIHSSKERGTSIHAMIERMIKEGGAIYSSPELSFVSTLLNDYRKTYDFISEKAVRFSLFGHIINGTPDLVLVPKKEDSECEIWDFKTGSSEDNDSYWLQLLSYAYCYFKSNRFTQFKLKLIYVDLEKVDEITLDSQEIVIRVLDNWKKTNDYSQANTQHCPQCIYQNLCKEV